MNQDILYYKKMDKQRLEFYKDRYLRYSKFFAKKAEKLQEQPKKRSLLLSNLKDASFYASQVEAIEFALASKKGA